MMIKKRKPAAERLLPKGKNLFHRKAQGFPVVGYENKVRVRNHFE